MPYGSQINTVEAMSGLSGLTHDIFVGDVLPNVRRECPTSLLFKNAGPGKYRLDGQHMVFAADYDYANGAMATSGPLPDHIGLDPVQGQLVPIRRYRRIAADSLVEKQASGAGAFEDFATRLTKILWSSWKSMEIRHSIGASSCLLGVVASRTSSTKFIIKDAYGNVGTNPLSNLSKNTIICWYDQTATAGIDGAAKIKSINYSTREIEVDSATTWEPGDSPAAGDYIYMATTNVISRDYFEAERNLGPNGLGTIVDPAAALTTVFNISETDHPRHKPFRKASVTFDHIELTEHWQQLGQKRGFDVTPATDVALMFPAAVAQIARSLMGYQQQAYTGTDLKGGYSGVTVNGLPLLADGFFYHNVAMTLYKQGLFRVNLGGEPGFWTEDGNQWQRIADFDGKEAFVAEYMNTFCENRGANGALTGITVDMTSGDFTAGIPDY